MVKQPPGQTGFPTSGLGGSLKSAPHSPCHFLTGLATGHLSWDTSVPDTVVRSCPKTGLKEQELQGMAFPSAPSMTRDLCV